ncbi:MAG TPA: aldo/keto reductase [Bryobacteraceae bacterium]|nr:aldo/keto reductase [Bryobacteraceae bacterium]
MLTRREILAALGAVPAAGVLSSGRLYAQAAATFPRRLLGRTGRTVVPLGLGGQASLQWTGPGIDAPDIITRAVELGVNYLDSANLYGPSQANYGEAFRRLHLAPADPSYNRTLRESLYIATKTVQRYAVNPGSSTPTAVDDLKRSLTQMFGDGHGAIPEGAYLDAIQMHSLGSFQDVDQIYEGYGERGSKMPDRIGALAAMLDYRDGTNYTGLNPGHRRWVRHIGVTGHQSSPVLMSAIRRDYEQILDTVLVALNAHDRLCSSHQNNVLPLAVSRGMGVIAMKLFADGAFYGKEKRFSRMPADVIHTVGKDGAVAYADLVRYPLSLPGVSVAITGIGHIQRDQPEADQLVANLTAAVKDPATGAERIRIENDAAARHSADTNYFQEKTNILVQPTAVRAVKDGDRVRVEWNTAIAGRDPIQAYQIMAGARILLTIPFRPQLTEAPLTAVVSGSDAGGDTVKVIAV